MSTIELSAGPWCAEPARFYSFLASAAAATKALTSTVGVEMPSLLRTKRHGPLLVIRVSGLLVCENTPVTRLLGCTRYADLAAAIDRAGGDLDIRSILLVLDVIGGEVAGLQTVIETVERVARFKRIEAASDRFLLGAGYLVAAHCRTISAGPQCMVGGIGVVMLIDGQARSLPVPDLPGPQAIQAWWAAERIRLDPTLSRPVEMIRDPKRLEGGR